MRRVLILRGFIGLMLGMIHGFLTGLLRAIRIELANSRIEASLDLTGQSSVENEMLKIFDGSQLNIILTIVIGTLMWFLVIKPVKNELCKIMFKEDE